jgi:C_GCAxxG_C_C family probable redox protein
LLLRGRRHIERIEETMIKGELGPAKEAAMAGFLDMGPDHLNCAQAVVRFSVLVLGRDPELVVLARYFGGGVVRMGHLCGALSGAALSLGIRDSHLAGYGSDGMAQNTDKLQQLVSDFEKEFGAVSCSLLTGHDIRTREGYRRFKEDKASDRCPLYVGWVCDHLYEML